MSDLAEDRKRHRTPEANSQQKQMRETSPEIPEVPLHHVSVMNAADLISTVTTTPVSTKSRISGTNLLGKCRDLGIDASPPPKVYMQKLHSLFTHLEARVTKQESELSELKATVAEKDGQIFTLRKDNAFLQQQISDVRADTLNLSSMTSHVSPTVDLSPVNLSEELAIANEGLANAEATIERLSQDCRDVTAELKKLDQKYKVNIRRLHLENDRLEQYPMRDSVKIFGVPYRAGEDTNDLVCRIAYSLGVIINEQDI